MRALLPIAAFLVAAPVAAGDDAPWSDRVRRVVHRSCCGVLACYERARAMRPSLRGKAVVRLTIAPTGRVTAATIDSSTVGEDVDRCIVDLARTWRLPPPDDETAIAIPFVFTRPR